MAWSTVEVFANRGMAEVAGSALSSAGVPYRVVADDAGGQGWPIGLRHSGAELRVPTEELESARGLLTAGDQADEADREPIDAAGLTMGVSGPVRAVVGVLVVVFVVALLVGLWP